MNLVERFELVSRRAPDSAALIDYTRVISYGELNRDANAVASLLLRNAKPPSVVAIALRQSPMLSTALLGCLKAGACYVPLDPGNPRERLQALIQFSDAHYLLTDTEGLAHIGPAGQDIEIINLDILPAVEDAPEPCVPIDPDQKAFVLFTSGSTGRPKGVVHTHRSALNWVHVHSKDFQITPEDRQTQLYTPSVYGAARDGFNALMNGATLCYYSVSDQGLLGLRSWIEEQGITIFCCVATVFRKFVNTLPRRYRIPSVRLVKLGGERVTWSDVDGFSRHFDTRCRLSCGLAMSETSAVTQVFVDDQIPRRGAFVPLGEAVEGKTVLLLDDSGMPVRQGETGEIVVRSEYLSQGYLGQPELTARRFVRDPDGGAIVTFHTGDLGRRDEDGSFEYVARRDAQAKVRGFRVDINEVEATLRALDGVAEVAVLLESDDSGNRLLAYVVAAGAATMLTESVLRGALADKLPQYMVPSRFSFIDSLPQTASGKLDRNALQVRASSIKPVKQVPPPKPESQSERDTGAVPDCFPDPTFTPCSAETPTISTLCTLWSKHLRLPAVQPEDNFFDLGGQSLAALEMMAEVEDRFGARLPLSVLMKAPTVAKFFELIRRSDGRGEWEQLVPLQPEGEGPALFLVHPIGCNLLVYSDIARRLAPRGQPVIGIQPRGLDAAQAPLTSLTEMAAHYCEAIKAHQVQGPYLLGGASFGGRVAYEMARRFVAAGETVQLLALFDTSPEKILAPYELLSPRMRAWFRQMNRMQSHWVNFTARSFSQRLVYARDTWRNALKRFSGNNTVPENIQRVFKANQQASRDYIVRPYRGTVTLFRARIDPFGVNAPRDHGWSKYADVVDVHMVDGYHGECCREPHAASLVAELEQCLDRVERIGVVGIPPIVITETEVHDRAVRAS